MQCANILTPDFNANAIALNIHLGNVLGFVIHFTLDFNASAIALNIHVATVLGFVIHRASELMPIP